MLPKKFWYMPDSSQKTCITLIENGYIHTFEEILNLMDIYEKVKEEAVRGVSKTMPKDFRKETEILGHIEKNLKSAEEATRKGSFEDNYQCRMNLGKYFHKLEGYQWLAIYFYESSQRSSFKATVDVKLSVASLQQQALLEENRGNTDISLKYLKRALKMATKNSIDEDDPLLKGLKENLCHIYQQLGMKYLEQESDRLVADESISLKYLKKAVQLAISGENLETQAACYALQGKAMMKFNEDKSALKSFELYIKLTEKCNDEYGMCQGFFVISEIYKRARDWEKSIIALNACQELSKKTGFDIPFIFSAISLGQIETAKRNYLKANEHFEEAYAKMLMSTTDYPKKKSLQKLSKVMYGIGKGHLTFHRLINNLQIPMNLLLPKLLRWRRIGGPFTIIEEKKNDQYVNAGEIVVDSYKQHSVAIEKLISHELKHE